MCKVLILTNTERVKNTKKLIDTIALHLQETQPDGFGYSLVGQKGMFGERTVSDTFSTRINFKDLQVDKTLVKQTVNSFGEVSKLVGAGIFHGRTSTNVKGLRNTHPINKNGWSLIHNGVVSNLGPKYTQVTDNDTEHLVEYLSTTGVSDIEKYITGYYAIGAIDPDLNLHVIKDRIASLYVAYNKTLDCLVFGTTEDLIESVAKDMNWTVGPIDALKDDIHLVFDKRGLITKQAEIKSKGFTSQESKYSVASLGRDIRQTKYADYKEYRWETNTHQTTEQEDDSFLAYQSELANPGAGYTFYDWNSREMTLAEFQVLDEVTKRDCMVVRPDGTVVDADDYYTEKLA